MQHTPLALVNTCWAISDVHAHELVQRMDQYSFHIKQKFIWNAHRILPMRSRIILSMALGPKHVLMTSVIICKSIWVCHCNMHAAHTPWQPWYLRSVPSSWTAFQEKHLMCGCLINKSEWNTQQDSYSSQTLVSVHQLTCQVRCW